MCISNWNSQFTSSRNRTLENWCVRSAFLSLN